MTAKNDIFEGLHVLLVTEDDARAYALAKALRDRKAHVGDVKAGAKDPVALRGTDLILVDIRSEAGTQKRLAEMRADVRARWASVVKLDYGKVVLDDGAIYLSTLEELVHPHIAADKALTERARKEGVFETQLAPLGPSRTLRALAMAGPTLHVTLSQGDLSATVCIANELLVCAFVERGTERFEAWAALARVLGLSDAKMSIEKRAHPTAMNIMEPINQALEVAAQERQSAAALPMVEAPKVAAMRAHDDIADLPAVKPGVRPQRTLLGIPGPGAVPPSGAMNFQPGRPAQTTTRGMPAPRAAQGTPGPVARPLPPANDVAPPPLMKAKTEAQATPVAPSPSPPAFDIDLPAPSPKRVAKEKVELQPVALDDEEFMPRARAIPDAPMRPKSAAKLEPVRFREPAAAVDLEDPTIVSRESFGEEATKPALQLTDRLSLTERPTLTDRPTDPPVAVEPSMSVHLEPEILAAPPPPPPAPVPAPAPAPELGKPSSAQLDELMSLAVSPAPQIAITPPGDELPTRPYEPVNVARAIAEEIEAPRPEARTWPRDADSVSPDEPTTIENIDPRIRRQIQEETMVLVRKEQRRSRLILAAVVVLATVGNLAAIRYWKGDKPAPVALVSETERAKAQAPVVEPPAPVVAPAPKAPVEPAAAEPAPVEVEAAAPAPAAPVEAPAADEAPNAETLLRAGMKLLGEGDATSARTYLEKAVAADSKSAHAYAGLADAQLMLGDLNGALKSAEQAVRIRPKRARYRVQQGDVLKALGKTDEARAAWEKALEIDPNDKEAQRRLGS